MDALSILLKDLKWCPKLTREQQVEYAYKWINEKDYHAREQCILSVVPLAIHIATRWYDRSQLVDKDTYISAALEGIINGVDHYDPTRGALTTGVAVYIKQAIHAMLKKRNLIRIPSTVLADHLKEAARKANNIANIDDAVNCSNMMLYDDNKVIVDEENEEKQRELDILHEAINSLCNREQYIITKSMYGATLQDIGKHFGISKERVRQIHIKATNRLKKLIEQLRQNKKVQPKPTKPIEKTDNEMYRSPLKTEFTEDESFDLNKILGSISQASIVKAIEQEKENLQNAIKLHKENLKKLYAISKAMGMEIHGAKRMPKRGSQLHKILKILINKTMRTGELCAELGCTSGAVSGVLCTNKSLFFKNNAGNGWSLSDEGKRIAEKLD